jgi:hypothetical protein
VKGLKEAEDAVIELHQQGIRPEGTYKEIRNGPQPTEAEMDQPAQAWDQQMGPQMDQFGGHGNSGAWGALGAAQANQQLASGMNHRGRLQSHPSQMGAMPTTPFF